MLQVYLLYFDTNQTKILAEVLLLNNEGPEGLDVELQKVLQSDSYDIYDYSDEIAIIVDDRGFEKVNNPVFEVVSTYGDTTQLAGRLVFARNIENEFSTDIGSIKYEDIFNLRTQLQIQLIGVTKGE